MFGCIGVCILPISHEKSSALLLILLSKEIAEADEHVDVDVGWDQRRPDAELEHITRSFVLCGCLA